MEKILINFPTNFGDTVMALPVLDQIRASYPQSQITAIASWRTKNFLLRNNFIDQVIIFNKWWKARQKMRFSLSLRGKYNMIVDLKNSLLPIILGIKIRTPFYRKFNHTVHIKDSYLVIAKKLIQNPVTVKKSEFNLSDTEKNKWENLNLAKSLFIACSSLNVFKRYPYQYLKEVISIALKKSYPVVILGEEKDKAFHRDILQLEGVSDLVGKTNLGEIVHLLKNYARLILCVETGILHLGSYLNIPIVALFGPGDDRKAHPWSEKYLVVKNKRLNCSPCNMKFCRLDYSCMKIEPEKVLAAIEKLWKERPEKS